MIDGTMQTPTWEAQAREIVKLRAENARLRAELHKSEEWGTEMKRLANEQADLANTWIKRANRLREAIEKYKEAWQSLIAKITDWCEKSKQITPMRSYSDYKSS